MGSIVQPPDQFTVQNFLNFEIIIVSKYVVAILISGILLCDMHFEKVFIFIIFVDIFVTKWPHSRPMHLFKTNVTPMSESIDHLLICIHCDAKGSSCSFLTMMVMMMWHKASRYALAHT